MCTYTPDAPPRALPTYCYHTLYLTLRGLPFSTYAPRGVGSSLLYISIAYYMQKMGGWVQIACKIAYVLNGRPLIQPPFLQKFFYSIKHRQKSVNLRISHQRAHMAPCRNSHFHRLLTLNRVHFREHARDRTHATLIYFTGTSSMSL